VVVTSRRGKFSSGISSTTEIGPVLLTAGEPLRELERPALYERDNQDSLHRVEIGLAYEGRWLLPLIVKALSVFNATDLATPWSVPRGYAG
jgi:hypothetical protein